MKVKMFMFMEMFTQCVYVMLTLQKETERSLTHIHNFYMLTCLCPIHSKDHGHISSSCCTVCCTLPDQPDECDGQMQHKVICAATQGQEKSFT